MSIFHEFTPIFQLVQDYERITRLRSPSQFIANFDVQEHEDSYQLLGELPGIDQKNVSIEWTDASTLAIKGHTEYTRQVPNSATEVLPAREQKLKNFDKKTPKPYQPTVEEEDGTTPTSALDDFVDVLAPAESSETNTPEENHQAFIKTPKKEAKFWISERAVGSFHRTFNFPVRIDSENVRASLKNGILSVVVPKAIIPEPRKIIIE